MKKNILNIIKEIQDKDDYIEKISTEFHVNEETVRNLWIYRKKLPSKESKLKEILSFTRNYRVQEIKKAVKKYDIKTK